MKIKVNGTNNSELNKFEKFEMSDFAYPLFGAGISLSKLRRFIIYPRLRDNGDFKRRHKVMIERIYP